MQESGTILAAFVSPAIALGGVAAMAAPILIHLLARRRFRRIRWAAMDFLVDAERRNRRRIRLEEMILLALRCLAILLIGLTISRPFVKPSGVAALLGGRERTERVFVIDDSFSMGYLTDGHTAFSRAKTAVANLINRLRTHAPHDTVTVLCSSRLDEPVVSGALLDDQQTEHLLAQLEALEPSEMPLSVDATMNALRDALEENSEAIAAAIYVVSDFQLRDWAEGNGKGRSVGGVDALEAWAKADRSIRIVLIDVGDDDAENLAITNMRLDHRHVVAGVETRVEAQIANYSARDREALELDVVTNQAARATTRVEQAPARVVTTAAVPAMFQRAEDATVRVELPPDNLPVDDARTVALEVSDAIGILIVNGEPASDVYLDEAYVLATALRPEGEVMSGNRVDVIDESQLDGVAFDGYHLVVLCNVYRVSEPVSDALHRYVFAGGGLAIFLGDQVSDPLVYNATLYRDGKGLLPAALERIVGASGRGVTLASSDFLHPIVRVFGGSDNPFLQRIRFRNYYVTQPAQADPDVSDDTSSSARRPSARVIANFADADQTPAIVERPFGRGRVMLFTSSCDLEWNDWAKDPSYVVVMLEVAQYLARASGASRQALVGDALVLDIAPAEFEPAALVRGPAFPQEHAEEIIATASDGGGMRFTWTRTNRSGIYQFVLRGRDGTEAVRKFAVNVDGRESDLSPALEEDLRQAFAGLPVEYIAGVPAESDEGDEGRKEVWPFMLVAVLFVLMIEQFLAWRFGKGK